MVCYRHPDRETGVSCQRCERYICPECQTPSAVGFLCPEDSHVPVTERIRASAVPFVTYTLIAINIAAYLAQWTLPGFTNSFVYVPAFTGIEPWRMFSAGFLHSTSQVTHILFNMYSLFILGRALESVIGAGRFLALYLLSILGGSVAVLLFTSPNSSVLGASGGVFGLMAAYFVILKSLGQRSNGFVGLIAINLVLSFMPGVSWQAHLGGLVVGGLIALVYSKTRRREQRGAQRAALFLILAALIAVSFVAVQNLSALYYIQ